MIWKVDREPENKTERLRMDLDLAIDTLKWCHRCGYATEAERLKRHVEAIRKELNQCRSLNQATRS